jgi:hypothetical protein
VALSKTQTEQLFAGLLERRWKWKGDAIYGPNETMWLMREDPWQGDLHDFIERMEARLTRIARNRFDGFEHSLSDTNSLVDALKAMR